MDEFFVGAIVPLPYTFVPLNMLDCDGKEYPASQYQELFSLLGNMYGGDGVSTFCVPNLKGCEPDPNVHYVIAAYGVYPSRS